MKKVTIQLLGQTIVLKSGKNKILIWPKAGYETTI